MLPPIPAVTDRSEATPKAAGPSVPACLVEFVEKSAMDETHARRLRLSVATEKELVEIHRKPALTVKIPYFDLDGQVLDFCRYRYLEDPRPLFEKIRNPGKAPRYFQPPGTGIKAYFPPMVDWREIANNAQRPLLITEGEKKAACATTHGFACIGLGGVDSFASKKDDTPLLEELMEIKWADRDVVIVYDSDANHNPNVLAASVRLGRKLLALGAQVSIANLPADAEGHKQGIDDFILNTKKAGASVREAMLKLISQASAELFEREIAMMDFNRQFVYIRTLDKVLRREDKAMFKPEAFINRTYSGIKHKEWSVKMNKDGSITKIAALKSTATEWMNWEYRLTCESLAFDPSTEDEFVGQDYNLWTGWEVTPEEGDVSLWKELLDQLFQDHPQSERRWFEQWLAHPFQKPGAKLKTAVLLWSRCEGNGKSTVLEAIRYLYGSHFAPMNDSAVDLKWTDWLVNKLFVGVDDISAKNKDDHGAKWKNLITAPKIAVQKRFTDVFEIDSHVNFGMTSNEPNALRLSPNDRRYAVWEVAAWGTKEERAEFFGRFYKWIASEKGKSALLYHFMAMDMAGFNADAPAPVSASKADMQDLSRGPLEQWVQDLADAPDATLRINQLPLKGDLWTADDLCKLYNGLAANRSPVSRITMGMALTALNFAQFGGKKQIILANGKRARLFIVRNRDKWEIATADEARQHYKETRE